MIPVSSEVLTPEPTNFDQGCRKRGTAWLLKNPKEQRKEKRPRDFWSPFRPALADAFSNLCAYGAMYEPNGTVDHFISVDTAEEQAYEWSNYRYATGWINSSKSKRPDIMDVFQVGPEWFELLLPSLQLVAVLEKIPPMHHVLAENTIKALHLRDDERIIRQRREWLSMYEQGEITLQGLRRKAPMIAAAVAKREGIQI